MAPDPSTTDTATAAMSASYVKVLLMQLAVLAALWWLEHAFN